MGAEVAAVAAVVALPIHNLRVMEAEAAPVEAGARQAPAPVVAAEAAHRSAFSFRGQVQVWPSPRTMSQLVAAGQAATALWVEPVAWVAPVEQALQPQRTLPVPAALAVEGEMEATAAIVAVVEVDRPLASWNSTRRFRPS